MYITRITIRNIRSLAEVDWEIPIEKAPGWHVIIGDNGSGKSTFLRCVALALVGPEEANALRENWVDWVSRDQKTGRIQLELTYGAELDKVTGKGSLLKNENLKVRLNFDPANETPLKAAKQPKAQGGEIDPKRYYWGRGTGWFSASYGPFRRFEGGDNDVERIFLSNPKLAAHLSIFGENVALSETTRWLQDLRFKNLENNPEGELLNRIKDFVNQEGFLPHGAKLEKVTSEGVEFIDGNGHALRVEELSDGYRSILSMTFELIRQMCRAYDTFDVFEGTGNGEIRVKFPGVVLIDEIDVHLHPTWQRRIGAWFRKHFPHIQFMVSTHSPLVCQAAEDGTVWKLPRPGTDDKGQMVEGVELNRLLYGNVLDAYDTALFGEDITRSESAQAKLERLAKLNLKELRNGLTDTEKEEQATLRAAMPTSASTTRA